MEEDSLFGRQQQQQQLISEDQTELERAMLMNDYWFQRLLDNDLIRYQHRSLLSDNRDNVVEDERIHRLGQVLLQHATNLKRLDLLLEKVWDDEEDEEEDEEEEEGTFTHGSIESHADILQFVSTSDSLREFQLSVYKARPKFLDAYMMAIQSNPRLVKFTLESFTPEHVPSLCHLLEHSSTLKELELGEWEWGQYATLQNEQMDLLCQAFGSNTSLQRILFHSVILEHTDNEEDTEALLASWRNRTARNQSVRELVFQEDSSMDAVSANKLLYIFEQVETLRLSQFPKAIMNVFSGLQHTTSVQTLECLMVNPHFDPDSYHLLFDFITRQTCLKSFRFEYTDGSHGGGYISPSTEKQEFLTHLLDGLRHNNRRATQNDNASSSLTSLRLDYGYLNRSSLEKISDIMEGLEEMELRFYYEAELPPSVEAILLKPTCCLKRIHLDYDALGFRASADLQRWVRQNKTIQSFVIPAATGMAAISCIDKFCWGNPRILELDVYDSSPELARYLKDNQSCRLQKLTIRNDATTMDDDDSGLLFEALKINTSLQTLALSNCTTGSLEFLAHLLPMKLNWKELRLTKCIVEDDNVMLAMPVPVSVRTTKLKRILLQKLKENRSLFRCICDLDEYGYTFQSDLQYYGLRNRMLQVRALPLGRELPLDVLRTVASYL